MLIPSLHDETLFPCSLWRGIGLETSITMEFGWEVQADLETQNRFQSSNEMYPKRYYTKMEMAKGYFACFGCQWNNIRKSQLASSQPYMAWRGELERGVSLFSEQYPQVDTFQIPRTQQSMTHGIPL